MSFSGPLPPPELLRAYNEIVPGAAGRIIAMAENQQIHRISLESSVAKANCKSQEWGLNYGFIITMTVIVGGFFLVYKGKNIEGLAAIVGALAGLVALFIYGKRNQHKELTDKQKAFQPRSREESDPQIPVHKAPTHN